MQQTNENVATPSSSDTNVAIKTLNLESELNLVH